jgi:glucose-6-phosphate 1-dehydrogenase
MFEELDENNLLPNVLSMCIQPDEGTHMQLQAKIPDSSNTQAVTMEFHYQSEFKESRIPDAYERLLLDSIRGDASLFTRSDGIEASWKIIDPVISRWETDRDAPPMATYEPRSWGPKEADELLMRNKHIWRHACSHE